MTKIIKERECRLLFVSFILVINHRFFVVKYLKIHDRTVNKSITKYESLGFVSTRIQFWNVDGVLNIITKLLMKIYFGYLWSITIMLNILRILIFFCLWTRLLVTLNLTRCRLKFTYWKFWFLLHFVLLVFWLFIFFFAFLYYHFSDMYKILC